MALRSAEGVVDKEGGYLDAIVTDGEEVKVKRDGYLSMCDS